MARKTRKIFSLQEISLITGLDEKTIKSYHEMCGIETAGRAYGLAYDLESVPQRKYYHNLVSCQGESVKHFFELFELLHKYFPVYNLSEKMFASFHDDVITFLDKIER